MQAFVSARDRNSLLALTSRVEPGFDDVVHSGAFQNVSAEDSLANQAVAIEDSAMLVLDLRVDVSLMEAWRMGVAFSSGVPIVVYSHLDLGFFIPILSVVTVLDDLDAVGEAVLQLASAIKEGMEAYAELATEFHTAFVERRI